MLYIHINDDGTIAPATRTEAESAGWKGYQSRHDWNDFSTAAMIALGLSKTTGELHLPTDSGNGVWSLIPGHIFEQNPSF